MRRLHYHLVDVFTDRAFGGNPLAVCTNGRGLTTEAMQSVAKEFNLSETTFVLPPDDPKHDWRVRIFTPGSELPMAGHPTVGTSFVLAREHLIRRDERETNIVLEEGVGPVPVRIEFRGGEPVFAEMTQPLPKFGPRVSDVEAVAVKRHRLAVEQVGGEQRDDLFRVLVGPIVIGAAGDPHVHAVGTGVRPGKQIGTRLRRRVGRIRLQQVVLRPGTRLDRPVDLVSRNVHKP